MIKRFFTNVLSSFMGAWIALLLFGAVAAIVVFSMIGSLSSSTGEKVTSHSIMKLTLEGSIVETEPNISLEITTLLRGKGENVQVLQDLVKGLQEGAENKDIETLYIECKGVSAAPATLKTLRDAIVDFKKSGKKILAYGDGYSQADYYVASASDSLFLNPMGNIALSGISGTTLFFRDLLDKIGVTFQVFKVGTYKSAVEPYINTEMSEPARAQLDTLYNNMWAVMVDEMASSRKMKPAQIDTLVNNIVMFRDADFVLKNKLADSLVTRREMEETLSETVDEDYEDINFVTPQFLASQSADLLRGGKNQVAVLYASGEIAEDSDTGIDCARLVPVITDLADEDDVKALVLRVNSPGGSVFGSAEIADALKYFQSKKKPLVVSMGDYAASGGYWISCHADSIFASPLTITGSIGVFGLIPDVSGLLQKIGVNTSTVCTNSDSPFPTVLNALTPARASTMQQNVENLYDMFVKRVATGRHLSEQHVRNIAEGRVWSAVTAQKLGLVDHLGELNDAIDCAARMAQIEDKYSVCYYPDAVNSMLEQLKTLGGMNGYLELAKMLKGDVDSSELPLIMTVLNRRREMALMPTVIFNY